MAEFELEEQRIEYSHQQKMARFELLKMSGGASMVLIVLGFLGFNEQWELVMSVIAVMVALFKGGTAKSSDKSKEDKIEV